jgi:hypothetical protein
VGRCWLGWIKVVFPAFPITAAFPPPCHHRAHSIALSPLTIRNPHPASSIPDKLLPEGGWRLRAADTDGNRPAQEPERIFRSPRVKLRV